MLSATDTLSEQHITRLASNVPMLFFAGPKLQSRLTTCGASSPATDGTATMHSACQPSSTSYASSLHDFSAKSTFDGGIQAVSGGSAAVSVSAASQRKAKAASSTSSFKGVTKHRSTGKFEAHLWDSSHIRIVKVRDLERPLHFCCSNKPVQTPGMGLANSVLDFKASCCRKKEDGHGANRYTLEGLTQNRLQPGPMT